MLRIARRTNGVIRYAFHDASGAPAANTDVEVVVYDASDSGLGGTVATDAAGVAVFIVTRPVTDELGPLRVEWTIELDGDEQVFESYHEVVGGHVATVLDLRGVHPIENDEKYPTWAVELGRDVATEAIEDACNTAFVRRVRTDVLDVKGAKYGALNRTRNPVLSLSKLDGLERELSELIVDAGGLVRSEWGGWGVGNKLALTYEYGYDRPPLRVARAVALLAAEWLQANIDEALSPRATSITSDAGTMSLVTAGEFGRGFDLPEVNAVVTAYQE